MKDRYYVPASHAKGLLAERVQLRNEVEHFWEMNKVTFPRVLQTSARAVLARQVSTFRFEDGVFVLMAEAADLKPTWFTYESDTFVTNSKVKRTLVRPALTSATDRHGVPITQVCKLVRDPGKWQGFKLGELRAENGDLIVDWHRYRLLQAVPDATIIDMSEMCRSWGGRARDYYIGLLSLFVAHAVLFEDYHGGESGTVLDDFTGEIFEPAVDKIEQLFGVRPLIVALPWWPELALHPEKEWLQDWRSCETILQPQTNA